MEVAETSLKRGAEVDSRDLKPDLDPGLGVDLPELSELERKTSAEAGAGAEAGAEAYPTLHEINSQTIKTDFADFDFVLCAGLDFTGLATLRQGLEVLGFDSFYDMRAIESCEHTSEWIKALKQDGTPDFKNIVTHYKVAISSPANIFISGILEKYPNKNIKIILTTPTNELEWVKQLQNHIVKFYFPSIGYRVAWLFRQKESFNYRLEKAYWRHGLKIDKKTLLSSEELLNVLWSYMEKVKEKCLLKENLLVFDVKDGWGPLCSFLGKPIPERPFLIEKEKDQVVNRSNDESYTYYNRLGWLLIAGTSAFIGFLAGKVYNKYKEW